ncbi:MAG TPA: RNA polymerase sigma factor [Oceanobacillus sp.]|nr:RNA polymerase sigma factor [Oceanobacillus sp.]
MIDTDVSLLKRIGEGDTGALAALYQKHGLRLLNYLIEQTGDRHTAEEALQSTMLAAWHSASEFRGDSKVSTWLFGIARNQASKARRSHPVHLSLYEKPLATSDDIPDPTLVDAVQVALLQLSTHEREALELVYYRGLTISEAAAHLKISTNTLKSRLHRARNNLRKLLAKEGLNNASGI